MIFFETPDIPFFPPIDVILSAFLGQACSLPPVNVPVTAIFSRGQSSFCCPEKNKDFFSFLSAPPAPRVEKILLEGSAPGKEGMEQRHDGRDHYNGAEHSVIRSQKNAGDEYSAKDQR